MIDKGEHQSKQVTNVIGLLAYLGLINKLDLNDIPERMLASARHHAAIRKQKNIVSFYSIPPYNLKTMNFANKKAIEYLQRGFTMQGWSYELLERSLGKEEANRVYPQLKGKPVSKLSAEVSRQMEIIALSLIEDKGWTTENEILTEVKLYFRGQKAYKERQLKTVIPELLDKYGLVKPKLNNRLKEKLGIECKGFPKVIVPESLLENEQNARQVVARPTQSGIMHVQRME